MTKITICDGCGTEDPEASWITYTSPDGPWDGDLCRECAFKIASVIYHSPVNTTPAEVLRRSGVQLRKPAPPKDERPEGIDVRIEGIEITD